MLKIWGKIIKDNKPVAHYTADIDPSASSEAIPEQQPSSHLTKSFSIKFTSHMYAVHIINPPGEETPTPHQNHADISCLASFATYHKKTRNKTCQFSPSDI